MASSDQRLPAPKLDNVRAFPTPDVRDILVFIEKDAKWPANQTFAYGDAHPNPDKYPNHKMSYYAPEAQDRWARWYFSAPRADQDAYNFEITDGDVLVRTYIFPRDEYLAGTVDPDRPAVTDPDDHFTEYVFSHEVVRRAEQEYDGWFITVYRYFQQEVKTRVFFDDDFERHVRETVTIVPHDPDDVPVSTDPGTTIERRTINTFYDELITQTLLPNSTDSTQDGNIVFPTTLETIPVDVSYRFPSLLRSVKVVSAYAYAYSTGAAPSYSEDYYFDTDIAEPFPGPHEGRVLRFLTSEPLNIETRYPLVQYVEVADTIPLVAAWFLASTDGNSTFALAKEVHLPPTIHPEVPIEGIDTLAIVQQKDRLPMTPGYVNFTALGVMNVGVETSKTRYNLYEVKVTQINSSGVYGGSRSPFGTSGANTGAGDAVISTSPAPSVFTAFISANNLTVTGTATPGSAITVTRNGVEYGKVMSDTAGNFTMTLSTQFTDPVDLSVNARKAGTLSGAFIVTTNDLAPIAPTASISADLTTVSGNGVTGNTITISMTPVAQVETATVAGGPISADGQAMITFTSVITGEIILFVDAVISDTAATIAGRFRTALNQQGIITDAYTIGGTGTTITATKRPTVTYNDNTLNIATDNGSCAGLTSSPTSVNTTQGLGDVTTTVVSGVYSYTFDPPLPNLTVINVYATDAGGTSPSVTLTASATPPNIVGTPVFDTGSYTDILGSVEVLGSPPAAGDVTVTAYLGTTLLDSTTNDAFGNFTLVLTIPRINGETITLIASDTSDPTVKSPAVNISATNLNLPVPVFEESAGEYIGTAPDPSTYAPAEMYKLVVRYEPTSEEVEFDVFPLNNEFVFDFEDFTGNLGNQNGERYEVFFRFDIDTTAGVYLADGPAAFINSPVVPLPGAIIGQFPPAAHYPFDRRWDQNWHTNIPAPGPTLVDGDFVLGYATHNSTSGTITTSPHAAFGMPFPANYSMEVRLADPAPGTTIQIKFPGQDVADIGPEPYTTPYYFGAVPFPFFYRTVGQSLPSFIWGPGAIARATGWWQNAAMYTRETVKAAQPPRLRIIVTSPDGRQSETVWTRDEAYPWNDYHYADGMTS